MDPKTDYGSDAIDPRGSTVGHSGWVHKKNDGLTRICKKRSEFYSQCTIKCLLAKMNKTPNDKVPKQQNKIKNKETNTKYIQTSIFSIHRRGH